MKNLFFLTFDCDPEIIMEFRLALSFRNVGEVSALRGYMGFEGSKKGYF